MTHIKSYESIRPEDTIGYCAECNRLVRRTKKAECPEGHPDYLVQGAQLLDADEPIPELPRFNWAAFFMPVLWGPAYGSWAGMIVLPLWLFTDSVIRSAVYGITPASHLSAKIVTYALAVLLPVATLALMGWMGRYGWGLAWRRVYRTGRTKTSFATFKRHQYIWAVLATVAFCGMIAGAVYYWVTVLPGQMGS